MLQPQKVQLYLTIVKLDQILLKTNRMVQTMSIKFNLIPLHTQSRNGNSNFNNSGLPSFTNFTVN